MPRLHKREIVVTEAEIELRQLMADWTKKHEELTTAEWMKIMLTVPSESMQHMMKLEIRMERHGNTDTPGGWEG